MEQIVKCAFSPETEIEDPALQAVDLQKTRFTADVGMEMGEREDVCCSFPSTLREDGKVQTSV